MTDFLHFETEIEKEKHIKTYLVGDRKDTHISGEDYSIRLSQTGYDMLEVNPGILSQIINNQIETYPLGRGSEAEVGYFYAHSRNGDRRYVLRTVFDPYGLPATVTHSSYLLLSAGGINTVTPCLAMTAKDGINFNIYLCGDPIYPTIETYIRKLFLDDPKNLDSIERKMKLTHAAAQRILYSPRAARILGTVNYQVDLLEGWVDSEQRGPKYDNYLVVSEKPLELMVIDPLTKRMYRPGVFETS